MSRSSVLSAGVNEGDMIDEVGRERVSKSAGHRRVRRFVQEVREVGVEEGVRLIHRHLNGEHVTRSGSGVGRDAILAQPVRDSLNGLGAGSNMCFDLRAGIGTYNAGTARKTTHLGLGQMVAVILACRIAHVEQCGLKAGNVALRHGNREAEHARGGGAVGCEASGHGRVGRTNDEVRLHCAGPAERKREKGGKSEQTGCNHVE